MTTAAVELTNHADASDAALLALLPNDPAAMAELARRYAGYVHAIARRQICDTHLADDITQAVFLVLWRKANRIRPRALGAWLHQTARYAAVNAHRGVRRRAFHEFKAARSEAVMPEQIEDSSELLTILDDAIAALPKGDRQLIIDRYLRQIGTASMAADAGVSASALQKRIERALAKLRASLARRGRLAGGVAVTPAAVTAVLATAGPSTASASLLATIAAPSAAAATLAGSVMTAAMIAKVKLIAGVVLLLIASSAAVEVGRRHWIAQAQTPAASPVVAPRVEVAKVDKPLAVIGRLKSGPSIEFSGIAASPSDRNPWFAPDGRPLSERPYGAVDRGPAGDRWREYAFRVGPNTSFDRIGPFDDSAIAQLAFPSDQAKWEIYTPLTKRGQIGAYMLNQAVLLTNEAGEIPLSVRFDISATPWQMILRSRPNGPTEAATDSVAVKLGQPYQDEDGQASVVYTEATLNAEKRWFELVRIVAIDEAGRVHPAGHMDTNVFTPADRVAIPSLSQTVPSARLHQMPLSEVIGYLKDVARVPIEVDWTSVAAAGYDAAAPVRLLADNMTVADVVHDALDTASSPKTTLVAVVDGKVLRIGPVESFANRMPRVMAVPDLPLARVDRFEVRLRQFDEWIEFNNLPARPGEVAEVKVRTSDDVPKPFVGPLRAELANGPAIEVLGVSDNAAGPGKRWWNLDGSALANPPYESIPNRLADDAIEIPFRVFGTDPQGRPWQAAGMQWKVDGLTAGLASRDRYAKGQPHELVLLCRPGDRERADVSFRFIDRPNQTWLTLKSTDPGDSVQGDVPGFGACSLTVADERNGKAVVAVNLPVPDESITVTVSAVGRDGNPIYSNTGRLKGSGDVGFNVPLSRIAAFKLNGSMFSRWMIFRDVALRPGVQTTPSTEAGDTRQAK